MAKPAKILVVDDTPMNIELLNEVLTAKGYSVSGVPSAKLAESVAVSFQPDIILLDIMMPDMDGYQLSQKLLQREETKDIPIIFVTAKSEADDIQRGFQCGAVDYITKPIKAEEVWARVGNQLQMLELKRKQKHFMHQLSIQENRFRAILESSADPMLTVSPPGKITWLNPLVESLLGLKDYELSGRLLTEFLSDEYCIQYENSLSHDGFGSGELDSILDSGFKPVTLVTTDGKTIDIDLAINRVGINYPLYLCHFHMR